MNVGKKLMFIKLINFNLIFIYEIFIIQ